MIARLLALAAALLLAACGERAADWPPPSPALWRVTSPKGQTGWLFGTVHAMPDGVKWRTDGLAEVKDRAGVLIVEIADAGADGSALFDNLARTPGQLALSQRVTADNRDELAQMLAAKGLDEGEFSDVETWAAALMLGASGADEAANGVDKALLAEAQTVRALETRAGQLRLFDRLSEADQRVLLANAIAEGGAADPQAPLRAWLTGDVEALERYAAGGFLADASLRDVLLARRNQSWLGPVIASIEAGEQPLVAVGAIHMTGPEGLPALLAARGFRVSRVQ